MTLNLYKGSPSILFSFFIAVTMRHNFILFICFLISRENSVRESPCVCSSFCETLAPRTVPGTRVVLGRRC